MGRSGSDARGVMPGRDTVLPHGMARITCSSCSHRFAFVALVPRAILSRSFSYLSCAYESQAQKSKGELHPRTLNQIAPAERTYQHIGRRCRGASCRCDVGPTSSVSRVLALLWRRGRFGSGPDPSLKPRLKLGQNLLAPYPNAVHGRGVRVCPLSKLWHSQEQVQGMWVSLG
jgi:hypothetical protein